MMNTRILTRHQNECSGFLNYIITHNKLEGKTFCVLLGLANAWKTKSCWQVLIKKDVNSLLDGGNNISKSTGNGKNFFAD